MGLKPGWVKGENYVVKEGDVGENGAGWVVGEADQPRLSGRVELEFGQRRRGTSRRSDL